MTRGAASVDARATSATFDIEEAAYSLNANTNTVGAPPFSSIQKGDGRPETAPTWGECYRVGSVAIGWC